MQKTAVIFGGTGFIGLHFARYLVECEGYQKIVLADIKPPEAHAAIGFVENSLQMGAILYIYCDVRSPILHADLLSLRPQTVANFAAVHREPGHEAHEYYETNLPGAENVCGYAEAVNCKKMLFTSSISPYGPTEMPKYEDAIPTPETAYGGSKLAAEYIHKGWQRASPSERELVIVRPGVVFGPGEGGNVSRLVRMITKNGWFVYAGNRSTRKAGIYVKELCHAMGWVMATRATLGGGVVVANMSMNPGPSMEEYVETVRKVSGRKAFVPEIPAWLLILAAGAIQKCLSFFGRTSSVNVVRVRKLIRSNNVMAGYLEKSGYQYRYSLESAMEDWRRDFPHEWGRIN